MPRLAILSGLQSTKGDKQNEQNLTAINICLQKRILLHS